MSLNIRNLVVIFINGETMSNLSTNGLKTDSVPVPGSFELINYLVTKCVGVDNVCVVFTDVDEKRRLAIDAWLTDHKFFKGTGLLYRVNNIAYRSPSDGPETMAEYVSEFLERRHGHILAISDCWSTFDGFEAGTKKTVTRVLLNPTPEEEFGLNPSTDVHVLRKWDDVSTRLKEFLKL